MTIFPEQPKFHIDDESKMAVLDEPHLTSIKLKLGYFLLVYIGKGFETDGASVPKEQLEESKTAKEICKMIALHYPGKDHKETLQYLIGTPFEMPRLLAAIVHDALYACKWQFRWVCDIIYKLILEQCDYDKVRKEIEYAGIRLFGWKNWKKTTDLRRDRTRRIVKIKLVKYSKIEEETQALMELEK